jgi:hypothetical protein
MTPVAITLHQPWASLIGRGKQYETRSWPIAYRGPLCIHAGKSWTQGMYQIQQDRAFRSAAWSCLTDEYAAWSELPLGAIVAVCQVTGCHSTETIRANLSPEELLFGNYDRGRYAWELSDIRVLATPVPCSGWQRLWRPRQDVIAAIDAQIGPAWKGHPDKLLL